jgi:hypothetical protein
MSNTTGNWNYGLMSLSPGSHNVQFFCKNLYGNTGSTTLRYFTINTSGETVLKPANTTFTVKKSIQLIAGIQLQGIPSYLNVYWNATYVGGTGNIGTKCYLNCNPINDCSSAQNCAYSGQTGTSVCTIVNPSYNYYQDNFVACKFFDPSFPDIPYEPYPNKTFRPLSFNVWLSPATTTIGTPFSLQINVKNIGLFDDYYNVSVSTPNPNIISVDPLTANTTIGPLKGDSYLSVPETGFTFSNMRVLFLTSNSCVCINVNSTTKPDILGIYNMNSVGCQPNCVQIKSSMASLPDFDWLGLIQIILLAAAIVYLKFK